uniref:Impact RWD domain protein n=1 Tax=Pipistrellus kuhlii TaxID=59472 RepID=A0A7J7Y9M4_PIPKU|nr:impact RWD domain protein [Pipistrellus kuhlii]
MIHMSPVPQVSLTCLHGHHSHVSTAVTHVSMGVTHMSPVPQASLTCLHGYRHMSPQTSLTSLHGRPSHVSTGVPHMSPQASLTCMSPQASHVSMDVPHMSPQASLTHMSPQASHVSTGVTHMSPWTSLTCLHRCHSHVSTDITHVSPRASLTCLLPAGREVEKKTEEEDVESEVEVLVACKPEPAERALGLDVGAGQTETEELPPIDHGVPITDRRSTFQAHLAPVVCPEQVKMVLAKLYENKKIASATHNIYAYRIFCEDKQTFLQDYSDDGETAAGGRLLHLMEILNVRNVLVVVSRWYGGILLGPDRFKHINNCARSLLVERSYTGSPEESSKALGKNKKVRKDKRRSEH